MGSCRNLITLFACTLLVAEPAFAAKKEEKPKEQKEKKEKTSSKKKKDKEGDGPDSKMSLPILKGHDAFGLKIPYLDAEGKLQMVFNVGRASRVNENHVQMADLQVETFDDQGASEMTIDLPSSILDLNTRVITTDSHVTIRRSDFEITGRTMEFDTKTKHGKLGGSVRMLIYDIEEEAAPQSSPETAQ